MKEKRLLSIKCINCKEWFFNNPITNNFHIEKCIFKYSSYRKPINKKMKRIK